MIFQWFPVVALLRKFPSQHCIAHHVSKSNVASGDGIEQQTAQFQAIVFAEPRIFIFIRNAIARIRTTRVNPRRARNHVEHFVSGSGSGSSDLGGCDSGSS